MTCLIRDNMIKMMFKQIPLYQGIPHPPLERKHLLSRYHLYLWKQRWGNTSYKWKLFVIFSLSPCYFSWLSLDVHVLLFFLFSKCGLVGQLHCIAPLVLCLSYPCHSICLFMIARTIHSSVGSCGAVAPKLSIKTWAVQQFLLSVDWTALRELCLAKEEKGENSQEL
jgi:hypothetical protein